MHKPIPYIIVFMIVLSACSSSKYITIIKDSKLICDIRLTYKKDSYQSKSNANIDTGFVYRDRKNPDRISCLMNLKAFKQITKERHIAFSLNQQTQELLYRGKTFKIIYLNKILKKSTSKIQSNLPLVHLLTYKKNTYIKIPDLYPDKYDHHVFTQSITMPLFNEKQNYKYKGMRHLRQDLSISNNIHTCESDTKGSCPPCQIKIHTNKQKEAFIYQGIQVNVSKDKKQTLSQQCFIKQSDWSDFTQKVSYGTRWITSKSKALRKVKFNHDYFWISLLTPTNEVRNESNYQKFNPKNIRALKQDEHTYISHEDLFKKFKTLNYQSTHQNHQYTYTLQDTHENDIQACSSTQIKGCVKLATLFNQKQVYLKDLSVLINGLTQMCQTKDVVACFELGRLHHRGVQIKQDLALAYNYYRKSCTQGHVVSCDQIFWISSYYVKGKKVKQDYVKAKKLLELSCKHGSRMSCNDLAGQYLDGKYGNRQNIKKAMQYYQKLCDQKYTLGCRNMAFIYTSSRYGKKSLKRALKIYDKSCKMKDGKSCKKLAIMYAKGQGGPVDFKKMAHAYEQGCAFKDMSACNNLAWDLYTGKRIPQDYKQSLALHQKACDGKYWEACRELGNSFYQKGIGVKKDLKKAYDLYSQGCNHNHGASCNSLAQSFLQGIGAVKDLKKSVSLFEKACRRGYKKSCAQLGKMYRSGEGVQIDLSKAEMFEKKAK